MKKILSTYMAFIAFSILVFASCTDKDPITIAAHIPVAEFEVAELVPDDDTKIVIINTSTYGVSFYWSFGDGATSTEQHPTHEFEKLETEEDYVIELIVTGEHGTTSYAKNTHTVKGSGSGTGEPEPEPEADFEITLDGDFADWDKVPAANLVAHVLDEENSKYLRLKEIKLCANKEYIYMYMKMDKQDANAMDIYLNTDGKKDTGYAAWMWQDVGADYFMQGTLSSNYDMQLKPYDEAKGGAWGWKEAVVGTGEGLFEISPIKTVEGTIVAFEGRIKRELVPGLKKEVKISVGHSGAAGDNWATSGGMPTVVEGGDKNTPLVVLLP